MRGVPLPHVIEKLPESPRDRSTPDQSCFGSDLLSVLVEKGSLDVGDEAVPLIRRIERSGSLLDHHAAGGRKIQRGGGRGRDEARVSEKVSTRRDEEGRELENERCVVVDAGCERGERKSAW